MDNEFSQNTGENKSIKKRKFNQDFTVHRTPDIFRNVEKDRAFRNEVKTMKEDSNKINERVTPLEKQIEDTRNKKYRKGSVMAHLKDIKEVLKKMQSA